jgi:hypothetical protein
MLGKEIENFSQVSSEISLTHARARSSSSFFVTSDEQLVNVLSSADVARRLMLISKRDKWQFVVKT